MSLIQCNIYARHAVVVADTLGTRIDGSGQPVGEGHIAKLLPLAHMPAVIAARGFTLVPAMAASYAFLMPDFDFLVNHFEEGMALTMGGVDNLPAAAQSIINAEVEVVLAGWSPRARMMLAFYAHKPAGEGFTLSEIHGAAYAPPPDADGTTPPEPGDLEDRVTIARRQAERIRAEKAGVAGGDLTIATLTRDGLNVEVVRDFTGDAAGAAETGEAACL